MKLMANPFARRTRALALPCRSTLHRTLPAAGMRRSLFVSFLACAAAVSPLAAQDSTTSNAGTVSALHFAITGNTWPATADDTTGYPTAIITKIYQDIEAVSPRPSFVIGTGNYMHATYSNVSGTQSVQMNRYLTARNAFSGPLYPAMGNQECAELIGDNCGTNVNMLDYPKKGGTTENYAVFVNSMLMPIKKSLPYYTVKVNGTSGTWTSKFVFIACNAWSTAQANWLTQQLSTKTTYTFVVRNATVAQTTAPCSASTATILQKHPYTLLITGDNGISAHYSSDKELIVGNGGAPLSGSVDYGYVIGSQLGNGNIQFTAYDYSTNSVQYTFTVDASGNQQ